jgi:hypothetical protein
MSEPKPETPQPKPPPADILNPIEAAAEMEAAASEPVIDPRVPSEAAALEIARREKLKTKQLGDKVRHEDEEHLLRKHYLGPLFWLTVGWLLVVVIFVVLTGFRAWGFHLSDTVLVAFITSTTLNVMGLFLVAARWLYPPKGHEGNKNEK